MSTSPNTTLDLVLPGFGFTTSSGHAALCAVHLFEHTDAQGKVTRMLTDPGHVGRRPVLQQALHGRGLDLEDIDLVAVTHAHWDHVQNVDMFPAASVVIHPLEHRYAQCPHVNDWATPPWTKAVLAGQAVLEVVDGDEPLPGVSIVEMPGHSPGSIAFGLTTGSGVELVTGDALHFASVAITRQNPLVFWDAGLATASIERALDLADVIHPGHDDAFVLEDGEVRFVSEQQLTMIGLDPDSAALRFESGPPIASPWIMPGIDEQRARLETQEVS